MSQTPEFAPAFVSVVNEVPEDLYDAMRNFVTSHPNWDQYRVMQVALAGFLFQQGSRERAVARHYLDGLFDRGASPEGPAPDASRAAGAATVTATGAVRTSPADATTASRRSAAVPARTIPPAPSPALRWAPPAPPHHRSH